MPFNPDLLKSLHPSTAKNQKSSGKRMENSRSSPQTPKDKSASVTRPGVKGTNLTKPEGPPMPMKPKRKKASANQAQMSKSADLTLPLSPLLKMLQARESCYYIGALEEALRNPRDDDYFNQLRREHFVQTFQAMLFCKLLKPVDPRVLQQKRMFLPRRGNHTSKLSLLAVCNC
jgi:hypothetical protein